MLRVSQVRLTIDEDLSQLKAKLCRKLRIAADDLIRFSIIKESIDARKDPIVFSYTLACEVRHEAALLKRHLRDVSAMNPEPFALPAQGNEPLKHRPAVIGFGPSGMFAALLLAQQGYHPIVFERGSCVETRTRRVRAFWAGGQLDPQCNVQFGEGGAGTFSDGKLTSRSKDPRCHHVLEELVRFGAPPQILYEAHPHIGTDILSGIVRNLREEIIALGGEIHFDAQAEDFRIADGRLRALIVNGEEIPCEQALLCVGHSARDTMRTLHARGMRMEAKAFAVGARVEHLQAMIDKALYGRYAGHPRLGAASYRMTCRAANGRGVYTFCMCPGGFVVPASSIPDGVVVNGMSEHARDQANANSALLVQVTPADYGHDPFDGMRFQEELEHRAFLMGGGDHRAPAQQVTDFLARRASETIGALKPSYARGVTLCDLHALFPKEISTALEDGLRHFEHQLPGFSASGIMTAVESRSSAPLRMCRDERLMSSIEGIMPLGEGAGYAGGIVTSAVDGVRGAMALIRRFAPQ